MLRPPLLLMVIAPTLPRLAETAPTLSEPKAKASWARFTVSVPVKVLFAVLSVSVFPTAVPVTTKAPDPVILPE